MLKIKDPRRKVLVISVIRNFLCVVILCHAWIIKKIINKQCVLWWHWKNSWIYLFKRFFYSLIKCEIFGTRYAYLHVRFFFSGKTRVELFARLFRIIGTRLANTLVFMNPRARLRDMYARSTARFHESFPPRKVPPERGNYFLVMLVHEAL